MTEAENLQAALANSEAQTAALRKQLAAQIPADVADVKGAASALVAGNVAVAVEDTKKVVQSARDSYSLIESWAIRLLTGAFTFLTATGGIATSGSTGDKAATVLAGAGAFVVNEITNYLKNHQVTGK